MMSLQRKAKRIAIPVDLVLQAENAHYVVETVNLSGTGLSLRTKKALPVGTRHGQPFLACRAPSESCVEKDVVLAPQPSSDYVN